jgi:Peptidase family M28
MDELRTTAIRNGSVWRKAKQRHLPSTIYIRLLEEAAVASVLEAMRAIKAVGLRPRRTIRLVLFTGEEQGEREQNRNDNLHG